jgi:hypothetical protein
VLFLDGSEVARATVPESCGCTPPVTTIAVPDAVASAAVTSDETTIDIVTEAKVAWAKVEANMPAWDMDWAIVDAGGGGDAESETANMCLAGSQPGFTRVTNRRLVRPQE